MTTTVGRRWTWVRSIMSVWVQEGGGAVIWRGLSENLRWQLVRRYWDIGMSQRGAGRRGDFVDDYVGKYCDVV